MSEYTILLAEDDSAQRELLELSLMISEPGIRIVNAKSREEILEAARNTPLDCAVIDFNLPPYQAPEIIEDLQEMHAEMPIIVISASEHQSVVIESLRTGVSDFVPKIKAVSGGYLWERVLDAIRDAEQTRRERRRINRRLKDLRDLAETDPLTGLANRRACDRVIRQMASRPDRRGAVSITMIDLDRFKSINDTQGHAAGDEALKQVAEIVRDELRANDIAARWGGEEMVVLRQSETIVDAWIWADNLRRRIGAEVRVGADKLRVTASMGVETVPVEDLGEEAIRRADSAMYLAKETGRNRVCTWPMARIVSIAHDLGSDPSLTPRGRLEGVLEAVQTELGATQREHTGAHGIEVRELSMGVAARFNFDETLTEHLRLAAEFHDIGRSASPNRCSRRPGRCRSTSVGS
jgi:diguanylate cyclase (GGDEF)-like protein